MKLRFPVMTQPRFWQKQSPTAPRGHDESSGFLKSAYQTGSRLIRTCRQERNSFIIPGSPDMEFIKKALKTAQSNSAEIRSAVGKILEDIEARGEAAVRELALKFDKWDGDFVLNEDKKNRLIASVPEQVKDDIRFAHEQISSFALAQRKSLHKFELINFPGVKLG